MNERNEIVQEMRHLPVSVKAFLNIEEQASPYHLKTSAFPFSVLIEVIFTNRCNHNHHVRLINTIIPFQFSNSFNLSQIFIDDDYCNNSNRIKLLIASFHIAFIY